MQTVRQIEKGESLPELFDELKELQFTTGNEHAIVGLKNGDRAVVSGGEHGIALSGDVDRVFAHTHPFEGLSRGPSPEDFGMLEHLGQPFSILLERGDVILFRRGGAG